MAIFSELVWTMTDANLEDDPWVLVEGPGPGNAEFIGRWLLAAAAADQTLTEQFHRNARLKDQIRNLEVVYLISFAPAATKFVELLMKNLTCFTISIWNEWGEMFAVMAALGFFTSTVNRYQMTVPREISGQDIETALLRLSATEDRGFRLHPEQLVSCQSKLVVENWERRLEALPWMHRVADREILLDEAYFGRGAQMRSGI